MHKIDAPWIMGLANDILYRLGDSLYGWGVLKRVRRLEEMERWSPDRMAEYKLQALRQMARHAYANVPLYRRLWDEAGVGPQAIRTLEDLSGFPKVTKKMLVAAGQDALDRTHPKRSFLSGISSGSTGVPFEFFKSRDHHGWTLASVMHGWKWAGWRLGEPWVRLQFRGELTLRARVEDRLLNCLYMPMGDFDDAFLRAFADRVARFRPVMLRGYAGATYVFASSLLKHGIQTIRPRAVVTTGDTLQPHYRQAIEAAFRCPIFDTYGGEGITVANQCARGSYHVLPYVHVEIAPHGPATPDGQAGRVILTSLTNTAMPMIRYDIADIAIPAAGPCPCGRAWPVLRKILGREGDIVVTHTGRHLLCQHFSVAIKKHRGVREFQVLQDQPSDVLVRLVTDGTYDASRAEAGITRELVSLGGQGLTVRFQYVSDIPAPPTGKRRFVISSIPVAAGEPPRRS